MYFPEIAQITGFVHIYFIDCPNIGFCIIFVVEWKNQKGLKTTLVPKAQAGSNASNIKNYVQSFYNSNDLTYLLLVGDINQIPSRVTGGGWSSGESDPWYSYISGNDSYPEFFVGRFSAENLVHVETQVERSIEYERNLDEKN